MKAFYYICLIFICTQFSFAQEEQLIVGQVFSGRKKTESVLVKVLNFRNKKQVVSDSEGTFKIKVKENDVIRIMADFFDISEISIHKKHLEYGKIVIYLDDEVGEIEEIEYYATKLTGYLDFDSKLIKKDSKNLLDKMGVDYFKGTPKRKLLAPVFDGFGIPLVTMPLNLEALSDVISGRRKKQIRLVEHQNKEKEIKFLKKSYGESYFIEELKIPKNEVYNFIAFCYETTTIKNKSILDADSILIRKAKQYRERLVKNKIN